MCVSVCGGVVVQVIIIDRGSPTSPAASSVIDSIMERLALHLALPGGGQEGGWDRSVESGSDGSERAETFYQKVVTRDGGGGQQASTALYLFFSLPQSYFPTWVRKKHTSSFICICQHLLLFTYTHN